MEYIISNEDLARLHGVELELLDELDRICRENGIEYFLDSGSALGAIRHQGFIPWDDDVDVGMLRADYERFLRLAPESLGKRFFLQTRRSDGAYEKYNAKLRRLGTVFPEDGTEAYVSNGIGIDIFPFDNVADSEKACVRRIRTARFLERVLRFRQNGRAYSTGLKKVLWHVCALLPEKWAEAGYLWYCQKENRRQTAYVACFFYRMLYSRDLFFLRTSLVPCRRTHFENREYPVMKDPDSYLTIMYGNYRQLPPEDKRKSHVKGAIVFSDGNDS